MNPMLMTDFYKIGHPFQYPENTTMVYSNMTARKSRIEGTKEIVFFGLQYFIKEYLIDYFNKHFFSRPEEEVMTEYKRIIENTIGPLPSYDHIRALHKLQYLPIEIKALREGSLVPIGVPFLTIKNTRGEFYWLTNFLESWMSAILWLPITSATSAYEYRKLFIKYLSESTGDTSFVPWMGHDFAFRGMGGLEAAILSGMGHLLSFYGTDTIPAILALEKYYGADVNKALVGGSVPATEHSVMCAGTGVASEFETFKRLITKVYPTGIISIVSDTFDLWEVLTTFMPKLKEDILRRPGGKVVIRPDSGDPVDIICGTVQWTKEEYESALKIGAWQKYAGASEKGVIELLWETFGGTVVNGYKVLHSSVGAIYGDSISPERVKQISERLMAKGFAPLMVYGIGSYTYQYKTRDTHGMAVKSTAIRNNGKLIEIYKDPITDDGTKKSAKGLLKVTEVTAVDEAGKSSHKTYVLEDQQTWIEEQKGSLISVFVDGKLKIDQSLSEIRTRLGFK
jgi:nicotinamide phosphoribosyltransferase